MSHICDTDNKKKIPDDTKLSGDHLGRVIPGYLAENDLKNCCTY